MCLIKQRAKNPEQKALRRQYILDATRRRFKTLPYEAVNLNHIAADVGISKAALYRYFRNKEVLFLELFVITLNELVSDAEEALIKDEVTTNKNSFNDSGKAQHKLAQFMTRFLIEHPVYCKLSAILHTILERNLTMDEAHNFKHHVLLIMKKYAQLIEQYLNFKHIKNNTNAIEYMMQVQQALIGVWHMTHPTGSIAEVIDTEPLSFFKQDFGEALYSHILCLSQN